MRPSAIDVFFGTERDWAAGAATSITAQQLEAGASHFNGRFGNGRGKWRLFIEADQDIQAMSLVESPRGHLTNLSSNGSAVSRTAWCP